jgi:hypothetical protein
MFLWLYENRGERDDVGGYVYWNADGNLLYCRCGLTCQGGAQLLAAGVGQGELAYDGTDLFFTVGDEIRKVPRPPPPAQP